LIKSNGVQSFNAIKDTENSIDETDEYIKQLNEKLTENMQDENITDDIKKRMIEKCNPGFWAVKTMTAGESFGEVALSKELDGYRIFKLNS